MNQEFLDEESAAGAEAVPSPPPAKTEAESFAEKQQQQQMALEVGKSPKLAKRGAVKELEKQPNGSFVASGATLLETLSPKPTRSTRTKVSRLHPRGVFFQEISHYTQLCCFGTKEH